MSIGMHGVISERSFEHVSRPSLEKHQLREIETDTPFRLVLGHYLTTIISYIICSSVVGQLQNGVRHAARRVTSSTVAELAAGPRSLVARTTTSGSRRIKGGRCRSRLTCHERFHLHRSLSLYPLASSARKRPGRLNPPARGKGRSGAAVIMHYCVWDDEEPRCADSQNLSSVWSRL